jgi:peroxiredoxin
MIEEGSQAPTFELPAVREGEFEQVALSAHLDDGVVILAFYPGDFNPACTDDRTDLDELDLFTMQKDVTILGVSADSVYSHRAFAAEYDLHVPLLSDARGEVAERYGVTVGEEDAGHLTRRAVVVVGPTGTVEYTWVADDVEVLPDVEEIRTATQEVSGDETAEARYRVGHAHYIEGRRAFTSAMGAFEETEWMLAKGDFDRAETEFEEAHDEFNTAVRFTPDDRIRPHFEAAERKAEALWRASGWLSDSANAFASGEGATGDSMRRDAETPLETAKEIEEPPSPADLPTYGESIEPDDEDRPQADDGNTAPEGDGEISLDVDLDSADSTGADAADDATTGAEDFAPIGDRTATAESGRGSTTGSDADGEPAPGSGEKPAGDQHGGIDEEELEEIAAELEEQTEAARQEGTDSPEGDNVVPSSIDVDPVRETDAGEPPPVESTEPEADATASAGDATGDGEEVKLDLADPEDTGSDDADDTDDDDRGLNRRESR